MSDLDAPGNGDKPYWLWELSPVLHPDKGPAGSHIKYSFVFRLLIYLVRWRRRSVRRRPSCQTNSRSPVEPWPFLHPPPPSFNPVEALLCQRMDFNCGSMFIYPKRREPYETKSVDSVIDAHDRGDVPGSSQHPDLGFKADIAGVELEESAMEPIRFDESSLTNLNLDASFVRPGFLAAAADDDYDYDDGDVDVDDGDGDDDDDGGDSFLALVARSSGSGDPHDQELTSSVSRPSLEKHVTYDQYQERLVDASFKKLSKRSLNQISGDSFLLAEEVNVNLGTADLSHSRSTRIPELPMAQKLQVLNLQYCINLVDLSSLLHLSRLEHLVLKGCVNLTSIPSLVSLMSLLNLDLSDCLNVKQVSEFPTSVKYLYLSNTAIEELPLSMKCLLNLLALDLGGCKRLKNLPELPTSLQHLHFGYIAIEELPQSISHLSSLVVLNLRDCRRLKYLPSSIFKLKSLKMLSFSGCTNLLRKHELPEQMAYEFMLQECTNELVTNRFNPPGINFVLLKKKVFEKVENLLTDNPKELLGDDTLTAICDVILLKLHSFFRITASKSLPIILQMENFVEFNLPFNNLQQLWAGKLGLVNLRLINLKHSNLVSLPDLSETRSLVSLNLQHCVNLVEVSSICNLAKLDNLDMRGCKSLTSLPSFVHLEALKTLHLSGCSNLEELPSSIGRLKDLVLLDLKSCTGLYKLPRSISDLKNLQVLDIAGCRNLLKRLNTNQIKELLLSIGNHFSDSTSGKEATRKKAKIECDVVMIDDDHGDVEDKETVGKEALKVERRKRKREAVKLFGVASEETKVNKHHVNLCEASMECTVQSFLGPQASEEHEDTQLIEDVLLDSSLSTPESSVLQSSPLSSAPALRRSSSMVRRISNKPQDTCNPAGVNDGGDDILRLQEHLAALKKRRDDLHRKNSHIAERLEPLDADLEDLKDTTIAEQKLKVEHDVENAWEHAKDMVAEIARKYQIKS